ncbi:MAG: substrate-binding periplasmic protein, partial [Fusobacteriota bacterium]
MTSNIKHVKFRIFLFIILFIGIFFAIFLTVLSEPLIKIGIYQSDPKVFIAEDNIPKGFFIDITNHIAKEKDLSIEYVPGGWNENIKKLEKGEIDLVLDASYNKERSEKFKFNNIFIIESWIQVFSYENILLEKIKDFDNKKIGVIKNSIQEKYVNRDIQDNFNVNFETYSYEDYPKMVDALNSKKIDLFLGDRFFAFSKLKNEQIVPKPIVLNPQGIYYLFRKDFNDSIISKFDDSLRSMKNDGNSIYYDSLRKWLDKDLNQKIPFWVKILFLVTISFSLLSAVIFVLWNHKLKKAIQVKTKELGESKKIRERIFESSIIPIVIMDAKTYQYVECNKAAVKASGLKSKENVLSKTPIDLSAPIQYDGTPSEIKAKKYIRIA